MRLSVLFVTVLGLSVMACSLATWGITYAFSYTRLTTMAADFSAVTAKSVDDFGMLILSLINDSAEVVKGILSDELAATYHSINTTEAQISASTRDLLEFARNETGASEADLQELVSGFSTFLLDVLQQFGSLSLVYASDVREAAALKVQAAFSQLIQERVLAIARVSKLYAAGFIDLRRDPLQNVSAADCSVLAVVCDASDELEYKGFLFIDLAFGAIISCNAEEVGLIMTTTTNGTHLSYDVSAWDAYADSVPESQRKPWRERCLTEPPRVSSLGVCPSVQPDCKCGHYPTCTGSFQSQVGLTGPPAPLLVDPYIEPYYGLPIATLTYPVYNASSPPRQLLGVSGAAFFFQTMKSFLSRLSGPYPMRTAVVLNDTQLTTIADCGGNATLRSIRTDMNLSLARNADAAFRDIGRWILAHRGSLGAHTQVTLNGFLWDILPANPGAATFFVVVGMQLKDIYGPILATQDESLKKLMELNLAYMAKLLVSENRTRGHLKATEAANLQHMEALKPEALAQLAEFRNRSQAALNASEASGRAQLEQLLTAQRWAVWDMLALHLRVLTGTIAWSIAVVVAVFLATLLFGVYGTLSITKRLQTIIQLMEDVALMHVEALDVPKRSCVVEVQRIQLALDKLAGRLALYKSFMPAGLFPERLELEEPKHHERRSTEGSLLRTSHREPTFSNPLFSNHVVPIDSSQSITPEQSMVSTTQTRITKRSVVAMVVNVLSFQEVLYNPTMTDTSMKSLLNEYLALVHGVVAQAHGNIDAVIGDQLLVTFNAHLRCCDAPNVAARTAVELQTLAATQLTLRLQLQIGLAEGWMYIGCAGYDAFKAMVALGSPLKVASLLAHLTTAAPATILTDPAMEERCRYAFRLRPVALVCLPHLGRFIPALAKNVAVYLLEGMRPIQPNEWMYEINAEVAIDAWAQVLHRMRSADSAAAAGQLLQHYLDDHPADPHAEFLLRRIAVWRPKAGLPLCERPDSFINNDHAPFVPVPNPLGIFDGSSSPLPHPLDRRPAPEAPHAGLFW
eukprot:EG_transcript_1244